MTLCDWLIFTIQGEHEQCFLIPDREPMTDQSIDASMSNLVKQTYLVLLRGM